MEQEIRILVLEDTPTDAELQLRELSRNGIAHTSKLVVTEEDFTREIESWSPDLILADYSLPSFDGLSALAIARERSPETPFIFVTGTMGEEIAIETLKNGATDYVLKQRLGRLVPAVRRALREAEDKIMRRRAEAALREIEKRFHTTFEFAASGIAHIDIRGRFLRVNQKLCELTGYTHEELEMRTLCEITHPDDSDAYLDCTGLLLEGKRPAFSLENRYLRKNGSHFWASLTVSLVCKNSGDPDYVIGIIEDISERKRLEEELADRIAQLEAALAKVKQLEGIIPICTYCKKIRDDKESWHQLESYITQHSEAFFSHGVCPECYEKAMSELPHIKRELLPDAS